MFETREIYFPYFPLGNKTSNNTLFTLKAFCNYVICNISTIVFAFAMSVPQTKIFFFGQSSSFSLAKQFRYSDNVEFARYSYFPRCISRASMREGKVPSSLKANTDNQVCKICQELTATKL